MSFFFSFLKAIINYFLNFRVRFWSKNISTLLSASHASNVNVISLCHLCPQENKSCAFKIHNSPICIKSTYCQNQSPSCNTCSSTALCLLLMLETHKWKEKTSITCISHSYKGPIIYILKNLPTPPPPEFLKKSAFHPPPPNSLSAKVWQRQNLFFQNITTATTIKVCCFCCCKLNLNLHCICWICQFQKCFSRKQNQWTQFLNTIITSL